jgi:uncharacterized protein
MTLGGVLASVPSLPVGPGDGAARAQEAQREGGGLLRFLFRREQPPQVQQAPASPAPVRVRPRPQSAAAPAVSAPAPAAVDKAEDAAKVLVVGDFLAGGLADGLTEAYAENPQIVVVGRANGSSGLVRDDHFDWPAEIGNVIEAVEPDVVVVMIGSNDRQQMRLPEGRVQPRSDAWLEAYEDRVERLAREIRQREVALAWVGTLPFRPGGMSSDMMAFNDIYRRIVQEAGGEFVDVWDGFVDENGSFATNGPDMNGQPAQLRAGDGINVTRAGRRKIAFYVEKPLERLLGGTSPASVAAIPGESVSPLAPEATDIREIDRTIPVSLTGVELDGGSELLGAPRPDTVREVRTLGERLVREGIAPATRSGRADDFGIPESAVAERVDDGESASQVTDPGLRRGLID